MASVLFSVFGFFILGMAKAVPSGWFSEPLDSHCHTLYWTTDYDAQTIIMEMHSNTPNSSWIALGFSDNGDVGKADFCLFWTDLDGKNKLQDVWTDEKSFVHVDGKQDCLYQEFKHEGGVAVIVFSRKFDTCDEHDNVIEDGTMYVVWATGPSPIASADGIMMSAAQHGFVRTRLLRPLFAEPPMPADVWSFNVAMDNFRVPKNDVYWCKIVTLSEEFNKKHHIVKFEARVTPGNEHLVHHMILKQCSAPLNVPDGPCDLGQIRAICYKVLAMGMVPFSFPQEAGFPLGGAGSPLHAVLEIHYTPSDKTTDWVDSSGLRLHVTPVLRQFDAELMELGFVYAAETALPPGQSRFTVNSRCVAACTEIGLPPEGITIFGSRLHSHRAVGLVTRHFRDGQELPEVVRENHYDPHNQPLWRLRRNVNVLPGDELITTCWFDTSKLSNVTLTGVGVSDEMCLDIVFYYPKVSLGMCKSSVSEHSLNEYFRKKNGQVNLTQAPTVRHAENYRKIHWTPENVQELVDLYSDSPIDSLCRWDVSGHVPYLMTLGNLSVTPLPLAASSSLCATDRSREKVGV